MIPLKGDKRSESGMTENEIGKDLKLAGLKLGFLLNFGDELMKNGITRTINRQLDE